MTTSPLADLRMLYNESFVLRFLVQYIVPTALFFLLTEGQFQALKLLHRLKLLRRYQEPASEDRNLLQSLIGTSSVTIPLAVFGAWRHQTLFLEGTFRVDLKEIAVLQVVMLIAVDTWYFWLHRWMHRNKFLWRNIHYHHHEKRNLNVYSTSYAVFVENLVMISPVTLLVIYLYMQWCWAKQVPVSRPAIELSVIGQVVIFNLGHSGMMHAPVILLLMLPTAVLQQVFGPYSAVAPDHEIHHLCLINNFSLNFTFWDKVMGSYKSLDEYIAAKEVKMKER
jgi:lathosterol oxidase